MRPCGREGLSSTALRSWVATALGATQNGQRIYREAYVQGFILLRSAKRQGQEMAGCGCPPRGVLVRVATRFTK
jgi:hypothetical protein